MRDVDPDASALLRSGRSAFRASASDRERVLRSLTRTLGDGALLDGPRQVGPAHGVARAGLRLPGSMVFGAAVLAIGAGALVVSHLWTPTPSHARATPPVASSSPPAEPAPAGLASPPSVNDRAPELPRVEHPSGLSRSGGRAAPRPMSDSLAEEVRLLSRAERQLSGGLSEDALTTLGEHERRFSKGALAEERMAAQVEALCALGRFGEARTDLTRLAQFFPKSAHMERARRLCGNGLDSAP